MTNNPQQQIEATDGLSAQSVGILVNNLSPVTLAGAVGTSIDDLAGDEVTLYVRVIDWSDSMSRFVSSLTGAANEQLQALRGSKAADSVLMSSLFFNSRSTLLHSFLPLDRALVLDATNYIPGGSTALYDAVLDAITSAVAYTQNLRDAGIRVKVVIVIMSDGEDNSSSHTVSAVRTVVEDLQRQEIYTLAFVAFGYNGAGVASSMGIPVSNTLDASADDHGIRMAFGETSKSVIRASQSVIGTSKSFF